jgi:transposase
MTTIAQPDIACRVVGGVDTHKDQHVAAALDDIGRLLGIAEFPATTAGYEQLHEWLVSHGEITAVGVEGCGSWGAGLARHLGSVDVAVVEVNRPNRQTRRRRGKSDSLDAEAAARAVLNGDARATPKSGDGPVEALRQLRVARAGAVKARTAAANQLHSLLDTAPDDLRRQMAELTFAQKIALAERFRPGTGCDNGASTRRALRSVARRWRFLDEEATDLRAQAKKIIDVVAPELVARNGVGYETAGQLLVTAGDNPERLNSERSFAALCASTPVQASSGRTNRHRLNRGGDRQANSALWTIVLVRMGTDPRTKAYVDKRTADGLSKREIMRCLKRYIARELYPLIRDITAAQELEPAA